MKKLLIMLVPIFLLTGCGTKTEEQKKEDNLIGTWTTSYELGAFGEISEKYTFKKDGQCVRTLNAGSDIVDECTYEINESGIRIIWENKIDKENFSKYVEVDDNTIVIGEHTYKKEAK